MAEIIEMPKLSDTMTDGVLVKWLRNEGDVVKTGEMLAEVETDKATMELECFFDGTLLKIFAKAGARVPVGSPLCAIGEKVDAPSSPAAPASVEKIEEKPPEPTPGPAVPAAPAEPPSKPSPAAEKATSSGRQRISPLARKLAAEKGIDLRGVAGTGPGGRIVRADILAAGQAPAGSGEKAGTARTATPLQSGPIQKEELVPVSTMRETIARRLVESKTTIPHFFLEIEVDAGPVLLLRTQLNAALESEGVRLSVNDFILKAAAGALRRVPDVNCSWESPAKGAPAAIRRHASAHVSFAVAIEAGLITPVVRDAQAKSVFEISGEVKALAKRARDRKLAPSEFTGGTFCVSNLGMMGINRFSAIINPPNAAILSVGTTIRKPVVADDGRIVPGERMALGLSCDHRVVDGATGAEFLNALRGLVEKPALLLL
jgi:pyruvate dehydrogenase E2 component (dihydrolipoamide acetyltransferase)